MKITGFDLRKSTFEGKSLAFGKVVVENAFEVDVQIVEGKNGPFVSWPSKKSKDKWYPTFKIIDKDMAEAFNDQIVSWFEKNVG